MKRLHIILIMSFIVLGAYGQQDAMYTHYAFNTLAINPGYAGSRDVTTITGLNRIQWLGFEGAPITQTLTLHSPVFSESIGLGLSVINDKIGPTKQTSVYADFAYRMKLTKKTRLALGLKGGGNFFSINYNELTTKNPDSKFQNGSNAFLPNFGAGIYLFNEKWYVGISSPKLIQNSLKTNMAGSIATEKRHYFFIAGYLMKLSNDIKFKPTTFLKATEGVPLQADLTALFIFKDKLELGAMYRSGDAIGALLGYNLSNQLRVGYSFDWSSVNTTGLYNSGSHEVMIRYDFVNLSKASIHSPRYF